MQGKLVTTQRKCKATSDLANGTILQYPSPYFIDSVTRILPKSGYSFCSHCTSQRLSRWQGYELPCIFFNLSIQWQMCDSTHRMYIQAGCSELRRTREVASCWRGRRGHRRWGARCRSLAENLSHTLSHTSAAHLRVVIFALCIARFNVHAVCCALHVACCMLRVARCALRVACCALRVACCALRVARSALRAARCMLRVERCAFQSVARCALHVAR